jgi:hypothetical protein
MAVLLAAQAVWAAEPAVTKVDWNGFRQQVAKHKLNNRKISITLATGDTVRTNFVRVADDGLVVRANRATREWATAGGESMVPRALVSGVRFHGKAGRRGLIGFLAGLGSGAGITAAAATTMDGGSCEGGSCGFVVLLVPVLATAGYFIGRAASPSAPSFVIERAPMER